MKTRTRQHPADRALDRAITKHASDRMSSRGFSREAIEAALDYGRMIHTRGADIHVIGRKEIEYFRAVGVDLSPFEGIQVVCSVAGLIMTVYRNRDFRGLRARSRGRRRRVSARS